MLAAAFSAFPTVLSCGGSPLRSGRAALAVVSMGRQAAQADCWSPTFFYASSFYFARDERAAFAFFNVALQNLVAC